MSVTFQRLLNKSIRAVPRMASKALCIPGRFFSAAGCKLKRESVGGSHAEYNKFDPMQWERRWKAEGVKQVAGPSLKPTTSITIKYGSCEVLGGNELKPAHVQSTPSVYYVAEKDAFYSLVLTDVDASPSEWQVWTVSNIPENHVLQGDVIAPYLGVGPSNGSGLHRFAFILYKQPQGHMDISKEPKLYASSGEGRGSNWTAADFAHRHSLVPVGLNFFKAKFDSTVTDLYAMSSANATGVAPSSKAMSQECFDELWERATMSRCMESLR